MNPRQDRLQTGHYPFADHPVLGQSWAPLLAMAEWHRIGRRLSQLLRTELPEPPGEYFQMFEFLDGSLRRRCRGNEAALEKIALKCSAEALACEPERLRAHFPAGQLQLTTEPIRVLIPHRNLRTPDPARQAPAAAIERRQLHNAIIQGQAIHHMTHALALAHDALEALDPGLSLQLQLHAELANLTQFYSFDPPPGLTLQAAGLSQVHWQRQGTGSRATLEARATLPHILVQEISKAALELAFSWALPQPNTPASLWAADLIEQAHRMDEEPWHWILGPALARRVVAWDKLYVKMAPLEAARSFALLPAEVANERCEAVLKDLADREDDHADL